MNAPLRDIPVIDLFTGLPWEAEPENAASTDAQHATEANDADRSQRERRTADSAGPQIAPHRQVDATALDLADAREEQRRGCCGCRRQRIL